MKKIINYIFIFIILIIIFIILNFYKSKNIFDDILIFGLWDGLESKSEYELNLQDSIEINVFTSINNTYKKIAPGSKGEFVIKFKRPENLNYYIKIKEKTPKPYNLVFLLDGNRFFSIEEMEKVINEKFINCEEISINWEWKYFIDIAHDIKDTEDGKNAEEYIFEMNAIIEEKERTEI